MITKSTRILIGDFVCIINKATTPGLNKKLSPNFIGPYQITRIFPNNTVQVKKRNKLVTYHANLLKPFVAGTQDD